MIKTYEEFCARVEETGFMTFTDNPWNAPSLEGEVFGSVWGDQLPDPPWAWKNRIAEQGRALYGHVLGGRHAFVSLGCLPTFFAAMRPKDDIEERYANGTVDNLTLRVARELRAFPRATKPKLRGMLGLSGKEKGKLEGALLRLERELFACVGAAVQRRNKKGEPYGWQINELWLCEAFYAPQLEASAGIDRQEARAAILANIQKHGGNPDARAMFGA